ncbi:hypothetical protein LO80_05250 [Candidatus Francisella endociliophora]|uniref:Mechanosensitive ion channel protein n=1 Tax=Candidatus Francisella endociliophora TaxID=653937 RepID=A0A097EPD4_9GAMM|nr:mechanosensitive ion channel domain-containing protein [Francisella sp. FSC1006]AIT09427.1 hypothetical protein LO80_05250 [Francisella sp. FSC1006]
MQKILQKHYLVLQPNTIGYMKALVKIILGLLILSGFAFSQSISVDKYINKASTIMLEGSSLESYIEKNYEQKSLSDVKLSNYKRDLLSQYNQLSSIESELKKQLRRVKDSLRQYISLNNDNKGHDLEGNLFYKAVIKSQPTQQMSKTDQEYKSLEFHSKIVQKRYDALVESYLETKEALSYVTDAQKRLTDDLELISDIRIKARNRDFFTKGDFLGKYDSWVKGIGEIEYNISFVSSLKYLLSIALVFFIYKLCSVAFYASLKAARRKVVKYRAIITSLSFFLRVFWNVLVATILVVILGRLFQFYRIEEFFAAYTICVYFILQNSLVIFLRFLRITLGNKLLFWFKSYVFMLMLLIFIQGVNFFSAITIIQPIFGPHGNALVSFIIAVVQLGMAVIIYFGLASFVNKRKGVNFLRIFIVLFSLLYCLLTFVGLNSLAMGILVNFLQIFVVAVVAYSIYSVIVILLHYIASKVINKGTYRIAFLNRLKSNEEETLAEYWIRTLIKLFFIVVATVVSLVILGIPYQEIYDFFYVIFFNGITIAGNNYFAISELLKSILVLAIGLAISKILERVFSRNILPYTSIDMGTQKAISTAVWYIGAIVSLVFFIASLGISGTALAFIISGLSVGVGFALQDLMKNFFAGFMLLVERPIKVGDWVELDGDICEVKKIKLRSTIVENFDLKVSFVPNSLFMSHTINNETFNPITRLAISVSVGLDQDIKQIPELLKEVASQNSNILKYPETYVTFEGYSKYTHDFTLRAFCYRRDKLTIETELRTAIIEKLIELGISIPLEAKRISVEKSS